MQNVYSKSPLLIGVFIGLALMLKATGMIHAATPEAASPKTTSEATPAAKTAPRPAEAAPFDVLEFDIEGNSVLPQLAVEQAVYPHLGLGRKLDDVESARAALEKVYQDRGYLSVSVVIPEQKISEGVVKLQVIEGSVERLKVSGNRYFTRSEIREQVPALATGEVPHFPTMQAQLATLNRMPDRRVTPLLRPGKNPGKLEVELAVEDDLPLHGSIEVNNRQSPDTTKTRLEAGIRYDNLFQKQHSVSLNYVTSPQKREEVDVLVASYTTPLENGRSLSFYVQHSNSNIASTADSALIGKGTTLGARFSLPLRGLADTPAFFHSLSFGVDAKNFRETQNTLGTDQKESPMRYVPFTLQYTLGNFWDTSDLLTSLSFITGLRGLSDKKVDCQGVELDQFECRRFGAQPNFSILRGDLTYTHRWQGWELSGRGDFQMAGLPLISNEQFLAGGADSVRGYYEGEAAGDAGWRLRTEVKTPSLLDYDELSLRALGFLDGGWLKLHDALPGQTREFKVSGTGFGLRLKTPKTFQLSLDWARALQAGPRTERGEQRIHVRLGANF